MVTIATPEIKALNGLELKYEVEDNNSEELKNTYIRKLKYNFNHNNIHINVKESIIGSSVIRLILTFPRIFQQIKLFHVQKIYSYG